MKNKKLNKLTQGIIIASITSLLGASDSDLENEDLIKKEIKDQFDDTKFQLRLSKIDSEDIDRDHRSHSSHRSHHSHASHASHRSHYSSW